jgi:hypothetical protein
VLESIKRHRLFSDEQPEPAQTEIARTAEPAYPKPAPPVRFRSLLRLCLALTGIPLLSLCALLVAASLYQPAPVNTGDLLLDRLFADFDQRGGMPWGSKSLAQLHSQLDLDRYDTELRVSLPPAATRSADILSEIKPAFVEDARYWLLLFDAQQVTVPRAAAGELKARRLGDQVWFLEEARRRGVSSPALMTQLAYRYDSAWRESARGLLPKTVAPADPLARQWPQEAWAAEEAAFRTVAGAKLEPFLSELLATGANEAGAHYAAARLLCSAGDYERAHAQLAAGNHCQDRIAFVMPRSRALWGGGPLPPETLAVEQLVFTPFVGRGLPDFLPLVKKLSLDAAERNDRKALQEIHAFGCRFATSGDPALIQQLVGLSLVVTPSTALKQFNPNSLSSEDWSALVALRNKVDLVKNECRSQMHLMEVMCPLAQLDQQQLPGRLGRDVLLLAGGDNYESALMLRFNIRLEKLEKGYIRQVQLPLWKEVEAIDYRHLERFAKPAAATALSAAP